MHFRLTKKQSRHSESTDGALDVVKCLLSNELRAIMHTTMIIGLLLFSKLTFAGECDIPNGVSVDATTIRGVTQVSLSDAQTANINIFVQNTNYPDGRCPGKVFSDSAALWQSLYLDYMNRGMTSKNIKRLADSISGMNTSGIYITKEEGTCYYNGFNKTISCGPNYGSEKKRVMAHENMHGWEFSYFANDTASGIEFYMNFTFFANLVYDAYVHNPQSLKGPNWALFTMANGQQEVNWVYGMQNQAEWGAEVFADWVYSETASSVWSYIEANQFAFKTYFNCLWTTDAKPTDCSRLLMNPVKFANRDPLLNPPDSVISNVLVNGAIQAIHFTKAQSHAIWNVCFGNLNGSATSTDLATFNSIIKVVAPEIPANAASYYRLGYADANHDNVIDWICSYAGPGPSTVGNGQYLWNRAYQQGTYTFIVSGQSGDDYVEYKQDPFLQLPTINGSLAQPQFREWQGLFNSAFGAHTFIGHEGNTWYTTFCNNLPQLKQYGPRQGV